MSNYYLTYLFYYFSEMSGRCEKITEQNTCFTKKTINLKSQINNTD